MPALHTQDSRFTSRDTVQSATHIMRRNLLTLSPDDDLFESVGRLLQENISGAPVVDDAGIYLGVLSEKGCITALTDAIELAREVGLHMVEVHEFMTRDLVTISGSMCVFDAIDHLLSRRISGAPVTDDAGQFRGVFSEKTAMQVLSSAMLDGVPGTKVESYMNLDRNRIIEENDLLLDVAHKFQETPYRRLPVLGSQQLGGQRLLGQVSRRDVLRAEYRLASEVIASSGKRTGESQRMHDVQSPQRVRDAMDTQALTASPTTDLLGITQMFLNSPYRRLPIVDGTRLVGQISRRDLLQAAAAIMAPVKERARPETLYLSGLENSVPSSIA